MIILCCSHVFKRKMPKERLEFVNEMLVLVLVNDRDDLYNISSCSSIASDEAAGGPWPLGP
jgi:hypothetical protein